VKVSTIQQLSLAEALHPHRIFNNGKHAAEELVEQRNQRDISVSRQNISQCG